MAVHTLSRPERAGNDSEPVAHMHSADHMRGSWALGNMSLPFGKHLTACRPDRMLGPCAFDCMVLPFGSGLVACLFDHMLGA